MPDFCSVGKISVIGGRFDIQMGEHVVLYVDRLIDPQEAERKQAEERSPSPSSVPVPPAVGCGDEKEKKEMVVAEEEEPLIQMVECRICQEEDHIKNLETPCACSGSLKVDLLIPFTCLF